MSNDDYLRPDHLRPESVRVDIARLAPDALDGNTAMLTALLQLRQALMEAPLPLDGPEIPQIRALRQGKIDQLEDYIIPRLMTLDAPLLVVVGGSTGAGKSTLVSTLAGRRVTEPGVLRPTTRSPVLVHNPSEGHWFGQDRMLPDLRRVDTPTNNPRSLQLVPCASIPAGIALLDAPDIDSVEEANRVLAGQLLAAADLWIFVTSSARYADQVPWEYLRQAAQRSTAVAVVLDRTPTDAIESVSTHLARMMASRGLKDSPLFVIEESPLSPEGLLPARQVAQIGDWLAQLAANVDVRANIIVGTLEGAVRELTHGTHAIADACAVQRDQLVELETLARDASKIAFDELRVATFNGSAVRGDALAQWQHLVDSGELTRSGESRAGALLDRMRGAAARPSPAEAVVDALGSMVVSLISEYAGHAAQRTYEGWQAQPAAASLIAGAAEDLSRTSRDFARQAEQTVRRWQTYVSEAITEAAAVSSVQPLSLGVTQGLTAAAMVAMCSHTAAANGPASPALPALEAVLGANAAKELIKRIGLDLDRRAHELFEAERSRYLQVVTGVGLGETSASVLREATRRVDDQRFRVARLTYPDPLAD